MRHSFARLASVRLASAGLAIVLAIANAASARGDEIVTSARVAMTQKVIPLAAGVDSSVGSNIGRRYLCLMNIGTGLVNLGFDQAAVTGAGWALESAAADGHQGGSMCWESNAVTASIVHAISADGSTVVVLEGQ